MRRAAPLLWLLAGGCAGGRAPVYVPPRAPAPDALGADVSTVAAGTVVAADEPAPAWWGVFHDPGLERAIAAARAGAPSLQAAAARVVAARALARIAEAERLPSLDATASGRRVRAGDRTAGASDASAVDATAELSWELDFFGRLARARDAAEADALATEEERRALLLTLDAEVASAWFDAGSAVAEEAVARETAELLDKTRGLVAARLDAGFGDELALHRVDGDLATARAAVPEARLRGALARHRLALLSGRPAGAPVEAPVVAPPPDVPTLPVGLPASLLRRRPDVRAAESRLEAADARVREAWAAFWPSVVLSAQAGATTVSLADLLDGRALFVLFAPSLRVPVFDAGRLECARLAAEARRDAAAAEAVGAALTAFADVADAVAGVAARREALAARREASAAARRAVDLAGSRFEARLVGYLDVIESQRTLAIARLAEVRGERALRGDLVALGRALGGGWQVEPTPAPPPPAPPAAGAKAGPAPDVAPGPASVAPGSLPSPTPAAPAAPLPR
ncbi:MAG: efflux transporter outer membrane subunit [Planctomycetes bacterium]|nr:efflux transporter outer membrane subunit [Planctomycetota bacterium]